MRSIIPTLALTLITSGCSPTVPTDAELRLAASSELRKLKRPEIEQANISQGTISNIKCQGTDDANECTFSIGGKLFKKTFAKTGSGAWSAYECWRRPKIDPAVAVVPTEN